VRAFERKLRSEQLVGENRTDTQDDYQISYKHKQFIGPKAAADLFVHVLRGREVLHDPALDEMKPPKQESKFEALGARALLTDNAFCTQRVTSESREVYSW
jgi:hypothetical protein